MNITPQLHRISLSASLSRRSRSIRLPAMTILAIVTLLICQPAAWNFRTGLAQSATPVVTVSAASYGAVVTPDSIVAGFGVSLATGVGAASSLPLPTSLLGTTVKVKDSAGTERPASLFFVSPGQVNYVIPSGTAFGTAMITVQSGNGTISQGTVLVSRFAPALFTADSSGRGFPAGYILRLKPDQSQLNEDVYQRDAVTGALQARPVDFGPAGDRLFLILYLTGLRGATADEVRVIIGSSTLTPLYAGVAPGFVGLDQLNVELPRNLNGRTTIAITAAGFTSFNPGEIEIAPPAQVNSTPPQVSSLSVSSSLAGQRLDINGSNFAAAKKDNQVQVVDGEGRTLNAQIETATATQLRVIVPFGAGSGRLAIRTPLGSNDNASAISLRTSLSGFVETTSRQPLSNVTVKVRTIQDNGTLGSPVTVLSNADGSFVAPDVTAGKPAIIEFDGGTTQTTPPYPKVMLKTTGMKAGRDNQFSQPVTLQQGLLQSGSPAAGVAESPAISSPQVFAKTIQSGNVIFDLPDTATVLCPDGTNNCALTLTRISNSRTPVNLPLTHFSSTIVQITPIGTKFTPGGRLIFPNPDNIPAGAQAKLFKLDQNPVSSTLGDFIAAGTATVSADGQRIETAANAITDATYYFASIARPTATLYSHVVESDGRPVRRAIVQARGQSTFTDGNGGFVLQNVPVITPDGTNDPVTLEVSFQRPDGRVDRTQRNGIVINAGGLILVSPDLVLPAPPQQNRTPVIFAPVSLAIDESKTSDFNFIATDADGQTLTVNVAGAAFASRISQGSDVYTLRLAPGAGTAGNYTVTITASDGVETATQAIAVKVSAASQSLRAIDQTVTTDEDTAKPITLTSSNPGGGALTYQIVSTSTQGTLSGNAPNLTYTPNANYNGADSFTFKVISGNATSNVATVYIGIRPINDAPLLSVPGAQNINAGQTVNLTINAVDPDTGQTLTCAPTGLPVGATFTQTTATSWLFSWTPTFDQAGSYTVSFKVADNGVPSLNVSRDVTLTVGVLWARTSGPEGGQTNFVVNTGKAIFIGTNGGLLRSTDDGRSWVETIDGLTDLITASVTRIGNTTFVSGRGCVHRSTNNGDTWTRVCEGIPYPAVFMLSFAVSGTTLYAGSEFSGKVFRTTDNGDTWTEFGTGIPDSRIIVMALNGTTLFAATENKGVYRKDLSSGNWTLASTGLPQTSPGNYQQIYSFTSGNGVLYAGFLDLGAGSRGGVYRSTNNGDTWTAVGKESFGVSVFALALKGTTLYAGTFNSGLYRLGSNDTWTRIDKGLTDPLVLSMDYNGSSLFLGTYSDGVFRSTDGENFKAVNAGFNQQEVGIIFPFGQTLFFTAQGGGLFRTSNNGESWEKSNNGIPRTYLPSMARVSETLFLSTYLAGIYRSTDQGRNWSPINNGLTKFNIGPLLASGNTVYAGCYGGIFRTTNLGETWTEISTGITNYNISSLAINGTTLFAGTFIDNIDLTPGPGILRSTDNGATWQIANTGLTKRGNGAFPVYGLAVIGTTLFAGVDDDNGVYRSTDNGNTWVPVKNGLTSTRILKLIASGNTLFAGTGGGGIFRSDDGGNNWRRFDAGLNRQNISALAAQGNTLFGGGYGGVFRATPNNQSWTERNTGLTTKFINTVAASNTTIFAGTLASGIFRSTDRGANWQAMNTGLPANLNVQSIITNGTFLFAGTFDKGAWRSTDSGATWTAASAGLPAAQPVNALRASGVNLFAATDVGVYRSSDSGASWTLANNGIGTVRVLALVANGATLFAGTESGRIFASTDQGANWSMVSIGLPGLAVLSLGVSTDGARLFAGIDGSGLYRSTNGGQSWAAANNNLPPTLNVYTLTSTGKRLFAGSIYGVFTSEDNGDRWKQVNAGLLDTYVTGLAVSGDQLVAGTARGGAFTSQLSTAGDTVLVAQDCSKQTTLKSVEAVTLTAIEFINDSTQVRKVYWLDYNGQLQLYNTLNPGQSYVQETYVTHPWVVTNASDQCLGIYLAVNGQAKVLIK